MELLQLTYFRDAAKLENFSKVAEKHYVAQPAVSHTISKLEKELGVKLFNRSGNRVTLNEHGEAFYEDVEAALERLERGKRRILNMKENTVKVLMFEGSIVLIPMIADFKKQYPDTEIILIENQQADLIIRSRPFEEEDKYITIPLFTERIMVALPKDNPLSKKDAIFIEDIRNQPIIGLLHGSKMYRQLNSHFDLMDYTPNIVVSSSNSTTIAEYVKNGFGIAFFPELSWYGVAGEDIVIRPFAEFDCRRTIYTAYKKDVVLNDAAKKFIEFGKEYFQKSGNATNHIGGQLYEN